MLTHLGIINADLWGRLVKTNSRPFPAACSSAILRYKCTIEKIQPHFAWGAGEKIESRLEVRGHRVHLWQRGEDKGTSGDRARAQAPCRQGEKEERRAESDPAQVQLVQRDWRSFQYEELHVPRQWADRQSQERGQLGGHKENAGWGYIIMIRFLLSTNRFLYNHSNGKVHDPGFGCHEDLPGLQEYLHH